MRILHFSTDDITGGAAKAAHRLHSALRATGHPSQMIVRHKKSDDDDVWHIPTRPWQSRFNRWSRQIPGLRRALPIANYTFNLNVEPELRFHDVFARHPGPIDILCLHWITDLLNSKTIRRLYEHYRRPIVWVMADQEPMTGGCHYSFDCDGFTRECHACPQLAVNGTPDHAHDTWRSKHRYLADLPICFVAPTSWGARRLRRSSLFGDHRVELIPYPIDTMTFRPIDLRVARDLLHLPLDKKIVLCGATDFEDRRKGMTQLIDAFAELARLIGASGFEPDPFLLVVGLHGKELMSKSPFPGKCVGYLNDDLTLALAYQAADIFVCPSVEDAGPMMIPEAMLCGTPVVAFDNGGAPDLIVTMKNGYLGALADAADLARGMYTLLASDELPAMRMAAHEAAVRAHAPDLVAHRHLELYESLLAAPAR